MLKIPPFDRLTSPAKGGISARQGGERTRTTRGRGEEVGDEVIIMPALLTP